jgi:hypothetical protein
MTKQQLSINLKVAASASQFEEGRKLFQEIIRQYPDVVDAWDVFYALKIQRAGVEIDNVVYIAEKFLDHDPVKNMYVLYLKDKYIDTIDQHNFRQHEPWIKKITEISIQKNFNSDNADSYPCNYTKGVMKLLKFYRKPNLNVEKVGSWITKLDPEKLSKAENKFIDSEGKERILASQYEDYYSILSDLRLKERKYEECIEICNYALNHITKFHYDNDIWFKRRKALALIELGKQDEGFEILMKLSSNRKGEKWFIFHEIAKIYFEKEEYNKALDFCVKAIGLPRDEDKKINLYADTARYLFKLNRLEDARLLAHFIAAITVKENLKQKSDILRIFEYFKIKPEEISDPKTTFFSAKKRVLEMFGISRQDNFAKKKGDGQRISKILSPVEKNPQLLQGKVVKILNENERGKNGFLSSDKKQYYFNLQTGFHLTKCIHVGTIVEFKVQPALEGKKDQIRITKVLNSEIEEQVENIIDKN